MKKMKKQFFMACSVFFFSACTSSTISDKNYVHHGINFGSGKGNQAQGF